MCMGNGNQDVMVEIRKIDLTIRFPVFVVEDQDILPSQMRPVAHRFEDRFFGGETAGVVRCRVFVAVGVFDFLRTVNVFDEMISPPADGLGDPFNFDDVNSGSDNHKSVSREASFVPARGGYAFGGKRKDSKKF